MRLAINETFVSGRSSKQVERSFKPMRDGLRRELWVSASTALVETAQTTYVLLCVEDITGRKRLEAQFLQAQKMEAIGQLAGGVAHDFNNILTATLLNLSFLRRSCKLDPQMLEGLLDLEKDAQRAAALTRQLLTFSRRQAMEPKRLDFSELIQGLSRMLARLLGEHITMRFVSPPEMMVTADAGMLEQVVVNLCVNARDAMPKGGQLVLTLDHQEIDSKQAQRHPDAQVGRFVRLSVADTGIGMDHATLQHIFEPFFTTKDIGKGTGLGLATVYGIAKQHRGWVEVESVLGQGSTFYVFLPVADAVESLASHELMHLERGGSETVLLVEDDQSLRRIASMVLRRFGYEVIEAQDSVDALRAWEVHAIRIQLLIADMVLPEGMSGLDLASRLRQFKPKLKVLISSGYSVDLAPERLTKNSMKFLAKPYQPETLVKIIRDYLDEA